MTDQIPKPAQGVLPRLMPASTRSLRLAVQLTSPPVLPPERLGELLALCRLADRLGVDQLSVSDHVVIGGVDGYPHGRFPNTSVAPYLEPLTLLAAVAGVTERIELTTTIVIAPLRPAALLAKTAATLDVLSGGRLVLGVGAGWQPAEFAAVGVPLRGRGDRLTDTIAACQVLWRDSPASFSSPTVTFHDVHCEPRPRRPDGIPVWFGATAGRRTIERVAHLGAGWIPPPATPPAQIANAVAAMRAALSQAGRDPEQLHVKTVLPAVDGPPAARLERSLELVPALAAAGATVIQVHAGPFVEGPDDLAPFLERLVAAFEPYRAIVPGAGDVDATWAAAPPWPASPWSPRS